MSSPAMLRTFNRVAHAPQVRTIVTRTMPKAGGHGDPFKDPHLVWDNKSPGFKRGAFIVIWGGVSLGVGGTMHALYSAQYKAGVWGKKD